MKKLSERKLGLAILISSIHDCYGLNVSASLFIPSLYVDALMPNVTVFGDETLGR